LVRTERPDLVILDLMLPKMDGLDVARAVRRDPDPRISAVPILMLTARVEETDKLIGLEVGADDYVTKPFSPREVVARVRAMLRRVTRSDQLVSRVLRRGPITVDLERRMARLEGEPLDLTPTEFDILATLMRTPGRPYSRMELLEATSGDAFEGYERTIDVHIKNLRRKLGDSGRNPRFVQTVLHHGYRFAADLDAS
jgi:two-component system alkaline phosphatase synthesis response regulator PhoP